MKKLIITLLALVALALPASASALTITWHADVFGWGYINNNTSCPANRCLGVAWDRTHNITYSGAVSTNTYDCENRSWNWGAPGCVVDGNYDITWNCSYTIIPCLPGNIEIDTWVRYTCPNGGYLYSTTNRFPGINNDWDDGGHDLWVGQQQIIDNGNGCFPASPIGTP